MTESEWFHEAADGAILWDGCDAAIVGIGLRAAAESVVVYDYDLLIECFVKDGMSHDEAVEWVEFNIVGAYVGDRTPIILQRYAPTSDP